MLKRRNALSRMRPWIATVAAYALALQVLLTGVAAGHLMAAGDASASSLFVICHSNKRSAMQSGFRTRLLEQTAALSSLIHPRASISVAPR